MFSERITDALVFRNERQRERESLPKSIYIASSLPFLLSPLRQLQLRNQPSQHPLESQDKENRAIYLPSLLFFDLTLSRRTTGSGV